jgi:hypothetical protein
MLVEKYFSYVLEPHRGEIFYISLRLWRTLQTEYDPLFLLIFRLCEAKEINSVGGLVLLIRSGRFYIQSHDLFFIIRWQNNGF